MQFDAVTLRAVTASSPEIVRWIEGRAPQAIGNWSELGSQEYARAFAVAGTVGYDVIGEIYAAMTRTLESGGTERDFADQIVPILQARGWLPGPGQTIGNRVQLIYDTNLRVARSVGRWARVQSVAHVMPYLLGKTVGDRRVRDAHRPFDGICLPVQHDFWTRFWPPLFFRCRCDAIQLSRAQFARRGLVITGEAELARREALIRPQSWGENLALVHERVTADKLAESSATVPGLPPLTMEGVQDQGRGAWQRIAGLALTELVTGLAVALEGG